MLQGGHYFHTVRSREHKKLKLTSLNVIKGMARLTNPFLYASTAKNYKLRGNSKKW